MCWMCRMCQKIRKSFYYMAYFCLLYGLKSRICTIEVYGRSTQPTHTAQAEAYFVEFHLYIILLKRPGEKFCTVLRSFLFTAKSWNRLQSAGKISESQKAYKWMVKAISSAGMAVVLYAGQNRGLSGICWGLWILAQALDEEVILC